MVEWCVTTSVARVTTSAPDPLAAVETADRAATAWALRDDEADEEEMQREMEKLDDELARAEKDANVVAGMGSEHGTYEPRAPKRRAERIAHRSPFESESEEAPADADDDRARKTAKRAHHRTASASGSESSLDLDLSDEALEDFAFDTADAMDLEEYAGLARGRRGKLERLENQRDAQQREDEWRRTLRAQLHTHRRELERDVAAAKVSRDWARAKELKGTLDALPRTPNEAAFLVNGGARRCRGRLQIYTGVFARVKKTREAAFRETRSSRARKTNKART